MLTAHGGGENMSVMHSHKSVVLGNRLKNQGLWKAGSVVSRGWGALGDHGRM